MKGKFYGVSLGPAVKDLIVPRATHILQQSSAVFLMTRPETRTHRLVADIIGNVPIEFYFPDNLRWGEWGHASVHKETALRIKEFTDRGETVSLAVFGDVSLYSPFGYLLPHLKELGIPSDFVPGIAYFTLGGEASMIRDDENLLLAGCKNIENLDAAFAIANTICLYAVDPQSLKDMQAYARENDLLFARQLMVGAEGETDRVLDLMTEEAASNGGVVLLKQDPRRTPGLAQALESATREKKEGEQKTERRGLFKWLAG